MPRILRRLGSRLDEAEGGRPSQRRKKRRPGKASHAKTRSAPLMYLSSNTFYEPLCHTIDDMPYNHLLKMKPSQFILRLFILLKECNRYQETASSKKGICIDYRLDCLTSRNESWPSLLTADIPDYDFSLAFAMLVLLPWKS
jgi:hypothetical protein